MDDEILKTVESILGKNVKIVDCEKSSSIREEEILLINGIPVTLEGDDGDAIKSALMTGQVPPCNLLNQILYRAGILRQPVQLETSLSVKSSMVTTEEVTIARDGCILGERSSETKEDNFYTSSCKEIWEPINRIGALESIIPVDVTGIDLQSSANSDAQATSNLISAINKSLSIAPSSSTTSSSSASSATGGKSPLFSDSSRSIGIPSNTTPYDSIPNQSNITTIPFGNKSLNGASLSCDSGHDDFFNSQSQINFAQNVTANNSISSCYDFSSDEADFLKSTSSRIGNDIMPTIFGTVASDQCPKDNINRRGLPQTIVSCSTKPSDQNISSLLPQNLDKDVDPEENALVYRDGNLISGPLDALIQHMVPTSDYYPDRSYLFAFLLSARLFIRPHELLAKICQLCEEQQNFNNTVDFDKDQTYNTVQRNTNKQVSNAIDTDCSDSCRKLRSFAHHFIQLLAEWIDTFPYDFRDDRLMQHVRLMTRKCIDIDNSLRKDVSTILQNLLQRLTILEKYEEFLLSLSKGNNDYNDGQVVKSPLSASQNATSANEIGIGIVAAPQSSILSAPTVTTISSLSQQTNHHLSSSSLNNSPLSTSIDISELCSNSTMLAHQLTHIELERLSYIGPEEFVQAFAKENPHLEQSFCDMKKTRNLESYVQWFNRLSYLVATEIVKHQKKKQRVRIVEYWIETARECFNIGNFNSLMAIIAGLNMSPISRLKKTWAKVQLAKFSVLEHQMDPSSNFNSYRSTLKAAMWRSAGATDERERIVIPFFSLLVKDLYFLNEGCSNKLPNGHINFEKFWQLAKQVTEFIAWKQVTCPFEKLPRVIMFLQTNIVLNENTLAMASFECEPPDNNHEKDRYKSLKCEQTQ